MLGMIFNRFAERSLVERAYWLVTCEIVTSGPRSSRCALFPLRLVPLAALFLDAGNS